MTTREKEKENSEQLPPAAPKKAFHWLTFVAGLSLTVAACVLGGRMGLLSEGVDVGSPLNAFPVAVIPIQLVLLYGISRGKYGRIPVFVVLLFAQWFTAYGWGATYGLASSRSFVSRQRNDLRTVAEAVDSYLAKTGAYPLSLSNLVEAGEWQVSDDRLTHARYVSAPSGFLLWLQGVDKKWDLAPTKETQAQLHEFLSGPEGALSETGPLCPLFLLNITYDPTNGSRSSGDVWRYGPAR